MGLLSDGLAPVVFRAGFIKCDFSSAYDSFARWKSGHFNSIVSAEVTSPLASALEQLQPLTSLPRRWLLTPAANEWVAYFDNGIRGPDPAPTVCYLRTGF